SPVTTRTLSEPLDGLPRPFDDNRHRGVVVRRHDVAAVDLRDLAERGDRLDADAAAFGQRIARAFHARDEGVRNDRAEQLLLHPARRLRRAQWRDADYEMELAAEAAFVEPRHVAAHDARIHAELRLHELRAGLDLGGEALRLPARRRIDRIVGAAQEEFGLAADLLSRRQFV